ncbi:MAG: phosphoribosylanthranilate isomerase [Thermodesulfobacteriota bacterium]
MIVQIYEIQTPAEAEAMLSLGVDHIGSVVTDAQNWRRPEIRETIAAVTGARAVSSLILLFNDVDKISAALDYYRPDIVHFCQSVTADNPDWEAWCGKLISLQATVRQRFSEMAIMRSVPIAPAGKQNPVHMMTFARYFEPLTDYFLTDTCRVEGGCAGDTAQPVDGYIGITGQTCDWQMAAELVKQSTIPVILAGGLSPENVYDGIIGTRPAGVDSCTRTNAEDAEGQPIRFRKDPDKVARFVAEAKRAASEIG